MKRFNPFRRLLWVVGFVAIFAGGALAAPHEVRLPLHEANLINWRGSLCVKGFNAALGDGCRIRMEQDALVVSVDPDKFPKTGDDARRAVRIYTAEVAPEATARQAMRWGIFLPNNLDDRRPVVLLIHGLDSEKEDLAALGQLMAGNGYQVGYFAYPEDQPIEESGRFFADQMKIVREKYPALEVNIVAHSMGGLVARAYIEGKEYVGGVDHLIMVGTPNGGSSWAAGQLLLKFEQQYHDWKYDPQWSWTWGITDGLGEAGRDLKPHSKFLEQLNSQPRRAGVKYTIVAGNQSMVNRVSAEVADAARVVPKTAAKWWGVRQYAAAITKCGDHFRNKTGNSDGPVTLQSVKLAGVNDVVIVPADHATLICFDHGKPPAAWPVIRQRLGDLGR